MAKPGAHTLSESDRRIVARWAAECAAHVLPLFEAAEPDDPRPREAIEALRRFATGDGRVGTLRALATRAHTAARDVIDSEAAVAAARSAGQAAAVAHMASHALGAPAYAALAAAVAGGSDAAAAEIVWAAAQAEPEVRAVLRRLPPPEPSAGPYVTAVYTALDLPDP